MSARPQRVIAVLGMHRSGTSCLTGSLQEAGLELGKYHAWNPYNLKGNRENQDIVDLHDALLAANGGGWDRPPRRCRWSEAFQDRARALLAAHAEVPVMGFKDPRTLLVLDGWKALIPGLEFVGIFRHPEAVVQSLERRSQMPRSQALELWYRYNRVLQREQRRYGFPLLCFDEEEATFNRKVDQVVRYLGLKPPAQPQRFYDNQLKNFAARSGARTPLKVRWLYGSLRRASL